MENTNEDIKQTESSSRPQKIHPSQDFTNDFGFFVIPFSAPDSHDPKSPTKLKHVLVVSDGRSFDVNDSEHILKTVNVFLSQKPQTHFTDRWTEESVSAFSKKPFDTDVHCLFSRIVTALEKHLELQEPDWYQILAIWIMGTYLYQVFETYPYLSICGFKGSGKSKLGDIIRRLAFNGFLTVNASESSLFRIVGDSRCTFILDESEQLQDRQKNEALRQILHAGNRKGSTVPRQEKMKDGGFETKMFDPYSPKAIIGIRGLEEVLASRTIEITMLRARSDKGKKLVTDNSEDWVGIRDDLYRFGLQCFREVRVAYAYTAATKIGNNRSNDLWSPIMAIAQLIFKGKAEEIAHVRSFAEQQIKLSQIDTGVDEVTHALILSLKEMVSDTSVWVSNKQISGKLRFKLEDQEVIKSATVGYHMKRLGISDRRRASNGIQYRITPKDIADLIDRFDIENPSYSSRSSPAQEQNSEGSERYEQFLEKEQNDLPCSIVSDTVPTLPTKEAALLIDNLNQYDQGLPSHE